MKGRVAILSIVLVAGGVAAGGAALQAAGLRHPSPEPAGAAPSGAWFCPYGGGPGWSASLSLTNPGPDAVTARVTAYGADAPTKPRDLTVPAHSVVGVPVPADDRDRAATVQYFGGWVASAWVAKAGRAESGVAAEPCLSRAGRRWLLPDGTTEKGQDAYVVVMNPFASEAVFSLTLVTERRTVRAKQWTNFVLPGGRSAAFHLNDNALGEETVATDVDVSIGRVAAASLGVSDAGGIRSAVGMPRPEPTMVLPGAADSGLSDLPLVNVGPSTGRYDVTVLGSTGPRAAQDLTGQQLGPGSDRTEHVTASGAAILVRSNGEIAAARRSSGLKGDQGSTAGEVPARAWVVSSAAASPHAQVRFYLTNPGRTNLRVRVLELSRGRTTPGPRRSLVVPAGTSLEVPSGIPPDASIVAVSDRGTFVPVVASYARHGAGYAVATGVPIPARWIPHDEGTAAGTTTSR